MVNDWYWEMEREVQNEEIWATFWISVLVFALVGIIGTMATNEPSVAIGSFIAVFFMFCFKVIIIRYG